MDRMGKIGRIAARGMEWLHWAGAVLMAVMLTTALFSGESIGMGLGSYTVYSAPSEYMASPSVVSAGLAFFMGVGEVVMLCLKAGMFRRAWQLLGQLAQGTPFSRSGPDMVRDMGVFLLISGGICLALTAIAHVATGARSLVLSDIRLGDLVTGVLLMCLAQAFSHGAQLQQDVDGLV